MGRHLRCDANVSVRPKGQDEKTRHKVEVKNLTPSASDAGNRYEIARHGERDRKRPTNYQETRLYNSDTVDGGYGAARAGATIIVISPSTIVTAGIGEKCS